MTAIAAIKIGNEIGVAYDSQITYGDRIEYPHHDKVFRKCGFFIGVAGDPRLQQILQFNFTPRVRHAAEGRMDYMVNVVVPEVRHVLKSADYENDVSTMLLIYEGHIYVVTIAYECLEPQDGLCAVGSGAEYAYGALAALRHTTLPIHRMAATAVQIASRYDIYTGGTVKSMRLKIKQGVS